MFGFLISFLKIASYYYPLDIFNILIRIFLRIYFFLLRPWAWIHEYNILFYDEENYATHMFLSIDKIPRKEVLKSTEVLWIRKNEKSSSDVSERVCWNSNGDFLAIIKVAIQKGNYLNWNLIIWIIKIFVLSLSKSDQSEFDSNYSTI